MDKISINNLLNKSGFTPPFYVEGCKNIKDFLPESSKTGIYVLHFSDGTKYVGKSKEISRRFNQHSNNFEDIVALSFKEVAFNKLDIAEEQTVRLLEKYKVKLRNILLSSFTYKKTIFFDLVTEQDQEKWLTKLDYNSYKGKRIVSDEIRERYKNKFAKFMKDSASEKVINFLKIYLYIAIPFPIKTELSYWVISCLPGSSIKTFCRINLFWQEVLTAFEDNKELYFSFHLMKSEISDNTFDKILDDNCEIYDHKYKPGGEDQCNLIVKSYKKAVDILKEDEIRIAIKKFNLNLMRKGNCQYSRYHCFDLADIIVKR